MDELKKKLNQGTLTRAELNAIQPADHNSAEWREWNQARVRANDELADRMDAVEDSLKRLAASLDNFKNNHLHEIRDEIDALKERMAQL